MLSMLFLKLCINEEQIKQKILQKKGKNPNN